MSKNEDVCSLLDILTLDMLDLMEQQVQCNVNIEKQKSEGDIMLAKARYVQGLSSVSASKLPTESSADFNALATVVREVDEETGDDKLSLKKHHVNKDEGYVNPMNWFGVLVPRCLPQARDSFEKALELVVESVNIQNQLRNCICSIASLKKIKYDVE